MKKDEKKELKPEELEEVAGGAGGSVRLKSGGSSGVGNFGPAQEELNPDPPGTEN